MADAGYVPPHPYGRKNAPKLTTGDHEYITAAYAKGTTMAAIARHLTVSTSAVDKVLRNRGLKGTGTR